MNKFRKGKLKVMVPFKTLKSKKANFSDTCDPPDLDGQYKILITNIGYFRSMNISDKSRTFLVGSRKFPRYRVTRRETVTFSESNQNMELESLVHQNNDMVLFEDLEHSKFSCLFGTRFLPDKFQDKDFSLNYKIYPEVFKKNFLVLPSLNKNGEEKKEIKSLRDTKTRKLEAMTSNFPTNDDLFMWSNEFKVGLEKCSENIRSFNQIRSDDESYELCHSPELSGVKKKCWDLMDLDTRYNPQETEKKEKKQKKPKKQKVYQSLSNKNKAEAAGSKMPPWHVDVIEEMAADLDGSLSNLGTDLASSSYNMSEALLSLPSLTVFKQEAPSPSQENLITQSNLQQNIEEAQDQNSTLHRLLQQNNLQNHLKRSNSNSKTAEINEKKNEDCRFQYVLAAATSIATKVTEETLTYLNQGQSYEIKLKKVGDLSNFRGKILKSIIRICFHERRLQYMEKEQILAWQASRPGERIIELDVPLSYGLFDVEQDANTLNLVSFLWDPTKEVGAYIKVNCISTEFTPKKHGGEKGVPFRIQVETFIEGETTRLHTAACQIKVFKLKGADRKHKQDREKILKRPLSEQDKYQPSYECTVLSDLPPEAVFPVPCPLNSPVTPTALRVNSAYSSVESSESCLISHGHLKTTVSSPGKIENNILPDVGSEKRRSPTPLSPDGTSNPIIQLSPESDSHQTAQWLRKNSFGNYVSTFANFNGADILRLTRDDLIQICGLADGIRLLYALHSKAIVRLTLYICTPSSAVYHAVYLDHMGRNEMSRKLAKLLGVHQNQIHDIFLQGPNDIRVLVTDEVISNIKDESMFSIEVLKVADESRGRFILLLKPALSST